MITPSLLKARQQYSDASMALYLARRIRNRFTSNFERDLRAMEVKHSEERVGIALDALWKAQCRYKIDAVTPV